MSVSGPLRGCASRQSSAATAITKSASSRSGISLSSSSSSMRPTATTRTAKTCSSASSAAGRCRYLSSSSRTSTAAAAAAAAAAATSSTKASETVLRRRSNNGGRWMSTDASAAAAPTNAKIAGIVDQISQLTLLETADLVASLKSRLNIPDMSFASAASTAPAAAAAPVAAVEEEEAAPAPQEKSLFTLKLQSFEATSKPKIIKEVKSMLGLSLVDSKKFVESAPKVLKEGVPKEEAEKIVALLKGLGGVVVME